MAQPKLQAQFFVNSSGVVFVRARPLSPKRRRRIYERDGRHCKACGVEVLFGGTTHSPFHRCPPPGQIDHIVPVARGGQNDDANLRLLCLTCNMQKGAK